jgi:hypothetical protein
MWSNKTIIGAAQEEDNKRRCDNQLARGEDKRAA